MAINTVTIEEFLSRHQTCPVLDVRSPGEFDYAHIPGALSFPLFDNTERAVVGTAYKQQSREAAIKIGLEYFGKKMVNMVNQAESIANSQSKGSRELLVHCWRGGMRSAAVAWLLDLYGFKVTLLKGGYKAYRKWVLQQLEKNHPLKILSGYTGSNKTGIIQRIQHKHPAIDLEKLAGHKGSAYGNLNLKPQPSQEFFENLLVQELNLCSDKFTGQEIWLEGESQRLGSVNIPLSFFKQMRSSPMIFLEIPFEERLGFIVQDYGKYDKEKLINATIRIKKKLGGLEMKNAVNFLLDDDLISCFTILLKYYDKLYLKTTEKNEFKERMVVKIESETTDADINYTKLFQE